MLCKDIDLLAPMREDLCEWINGLLGCTLAPNTLVRDLANGELLCQV
jgi:hypothetical protein